MNAWMLEGAVIPVSGAASGIGLAICQRLRAEGATPLMADVNRDRLQEAATQVYGSRADAERHAYAVDVRDAQAVDACFADMARAHGPVTHVVAAAGIVGPGSILSLSNEQWQMVLDVNLNGLMYFCRAAARQMAELQRGAIVTIASVGGLQSKENRAAYTTSKAGVVNLTRSMALDLGPLGIRANCVAPGVTDTPIQDNNRGTLEAVAQTLPLKRIGTAQEIANGVLFLLSDASSYITGETLVIDGGMTAKYR